VPPKRIVITGAPGTGKTVIIKELENLGHYCFHEIIRNMTAEAKKVGTSLKQVSNPLVFVDDPMRFNELLLKGRKRHHEDAESIEDSICFFDRGLPDVLAYMDYFEQKYPNTFVEICKNKRYDHVFILPPWKAIYTSDNERLETFKEAEELHKYLSSTYKKMGYQPIEVPKVSISERTSFVLENIE